MKASTSTSKVLQQPQEESRASQAPLSLKTNRSANTNTNSFNCSSNNGNVDGASTEKSTPSSTSDVGGSSAPVVNNESESDDAFVIKREEVLITDLLYKLHRRTTKLIDTHVICQDGYIPVHRCVLMACSKFLWDLLVHEDPAELATVCLPDYTVEQVLPLINSFYTGCIIFNKSELSSTLEIIALLKADSNIMYSFQPAKTQDKRWAPKMRHYLESKDNKQQSQHGHKNDNQLHARLGNGATTQKNSPKSKLSSSTSSSSVPKPLQKEIDPSKKKLSISPDETEASNFPYFVQNESSANENSNNSNSNSPTEVGIVEIEEDEEEEEVVDAVVEEQISHYEENSDDEVEMELLTGAQLNIDADIEEVDNVSDAFEDDNNVFSPQTLDLVNDVIIRPEATALMSDDDERDPLELESLLVDKDFVEEESDTLQGRTFEFETIAFDEDGQHKQIAQIITEPPKASSPLKTCEKTITKTQKTKKSMKEKKRERQRRSAELKKLENLRKEQAEAELQNQEAEKRKSGEDDRLLRKTLKRRDDNEDKLMKAQEHKTRMEEIRFSQELQQKIQQSLASSRLSQIAAAVEPVVTTENVVKDNNIGMESSLQSPIEPVEENRRVLRGRDKGRVVTPRPVITEETIATRRQSYEKVQDFQRKKSEKEKERRLQEEKKKEKRLQEEQEKRLEEEKVKERRRQEEKEKEKQLKEEEEKRRSKQAEADNEAAKRKVAGDKSKKPDEKIQIKTLSINVQKLSIPKAEEEQRKLLADKEKRRLAETAAKEQQSLVVAEEEKRRTSEREQKRKRVEELKRVKAEEQKRLKAEKELQFKKAEEARRQKEVEAEQSRKSEEEESRRKLHLEQEKRRKEAEEQQQLREDEMVRKIKEEARRKKEQEDARLQAQRKELEEKQLEEELSLKIEESMKKHPSSKTSVTNVNAIPSPASNSSDVAIASRKEVQLISSTIESPACSILPVEKSHTPNEQPRRKTTKFYEDLFQKRKQAEEERRRKQKEEEEEKKQQELGKMKETNAAKELIDILEGNDSAEKESSHQAQVKKPIATSETTESIVNLAGAEPISPTSEVKESTPSQASEATVESIPTTVAPLVPVTESSSTVVSASISHEKVQSDSPPKTLDTTTTTNSNQVSESIPKQSVECVESQEKETVLSSSTEPETTGGDVPIISKDQLSPEDEQDLEAAREVLVDVSSNSTEQQQQLYEFVDDIPPAIQETVVVTTDDFFIEMESDTINEVEVETEESGFNSGSVDRNSSEDGDERTSYEKVLEGCEQTLRPEQETEGTPISTPETTSEDPVLAESLASEQQVPQKESSINMVEPTKGKSDNDSDSTMKQRRKKKRNRKVREKHTQTKPQQQSRLNLFTPDIVLSTAEASTTAATTGNDSENTSSVNWTTSQGDGETKLCIKRHMEPLSLSAAAVALTRNPTRPVKIVSSVSGKPFWIQNPKVVLSRLSKRQCKYYNNRLVKYFARKRGDTPPPTLTKAIGAKMSTNSSSDKASKKLKSVKGMLAPRPSHSLTSAMLKSKAIVRSQSYDTDGRPPKLEPQLPSSSKQKRPASVPQSKNPFERRSFSASPSFVPSFDPAWYQDELKRCANCKRKYKVHTKATNCLLNHGFRRCWICLDLLPSHDASYEQHCAKFHTVDNQQDRVQCPICGKTLMMRGLPMHVTRKHLQPPPSAVPPSRNTDVLSQQQNFDSQREIIQQLYRPQPVSVYHPHHHMQQQQLYGHDQFYHQQPPFPYPPLPPMEQPPLYQPPPMMNPYPPSPQVLQPLKLDLKKIDRNRERVRLSESEDDNDDSDNGTTTTRTSTPSDLDEIDNTSLPSPSFIQTPTLLPIATNDIHSPHIDYSLSKQSSVITHGQHISSSKYVGRAHSPTSIGTAGSLYAFKESTAGVPIQLIPNPTTTYIDEELARRAYQEQYPSAVTSEAQKISEGTETELTNQKLDSESSPVADQNQDQLSQQTTPGTDSPVNALINTDVIDEDIARQVYPIDDASASSPQRLDQQQQQTENQQLEQLEQQHQSSPVEHHQQEQQQQQQAEQHQQTADQQQQQHHHHHHHHQHQQQMQQQYQEQQFSNHSVEQIHHMHQVPHSQSSSRMSDREREHHMKRHSIHKVDNTLQPKKRILHNYGSEPTYGGHFDHRKLDHHSHHHSPYFSLPPAPYYMYPGINPSGRDQSSSRISGTSQVPPPAHYPPLPSHNPHLHHHHHSNHYQQPPPAQHSITPSLRDLDRFPMVSQDVTMDERGNSYRELTNVNYAASPIPVPYNSVNLNGPKAIPAQAIDYEGGNGLSRPSIFETPPLPSILDEPERPQHHELQPAHHHQQQQQQQQHHNVIQMWDHNVLRPESQPQTHNPHNPLSHLSLEYISRNNPSDDGFQCTRCGDNFYNRENLDSHRCSYN